MSPRTCQIDDVRQRFAPLLAIHLSRIVEMNDNRLVVQAVAEMRFNQTPPGLS